jgi:hypothetical protein
LTTSGSSIFTSVGRVTSLGVVCFWKNSEEGSGCSSGVATMSLTPTEEAASGAGGFATRFTAKEAALSGFTVLGFGAGLHKNLWKE